MEPLLTGDNVEPQPKFEKERAIIATVPDKCKQNQKSFQNDEGKIPDTPIQKSLGSAEGQRNNGAEGIIELSGVFDYVNTKYGTPRTQLRNLSEKGYFETVLVDSSGVGSGPNIKCPAEAHLHLPTPTHKTSDVKLPSIVTSVAVSYVPPLLSLSEITTLTHHRNKAKLVYSSQKETMLSEGSLQFESRFESGNLLQAFKL